MGLGTIALYPLFITFCANFKQYSMEALVTILIMIITLHINIDKDSLKKSMIKFMLLAAAPFFSLTSLYILPFVFIYLLIKAKEKKQLKKFCYCSVVGVFIILIYYLIFLNDVIAVYYRSIVLFWWYMELKFHHYSFLLFALFGIFFSRNTKKIILYGGPIFLILILILIHRYHCIDRMLVFIIPLVIIAFLFPIKVLTKKINSQIKILLLLGLLVSALYFFSPTPIYKYRYRQEFGREIWSILAKVYRTKAPILISKSINTNIYYNYFYNFDYISANDAFQKSRWEQLPPNLYYIVVTAPDKASKDIEFLYMQDGKDIKILNRVDYKRIGYSYYIAFRKLK